MFTAPYLNKGMLLLKKELIIDFTKRRMIQLFTECIFLSALLSLFCVMGILPNGSRDIIIGVNIGAVLFGISGFFRMRRYYRKLADKKVYYISNLCGYGAFAFVNILSCLILPSGLYTWFFAITKVLRFSRFGTGSLVSALVFHIIMLCLIYCATFGMQWVFVQKAEYEAKKAALPPELTVNPLENKPQNSEE